MGRTVSVSAGHPATVLLYDKECEALIRERIPVQRAGAHYRFIHRTFQEHIAGLTDAVSYTHLDVYKRQANC